MGVFRVVLAVVSLAALGVPRAGAGEPANATMADLARGLESPDVRPRRKAAYAIWQRRDEAAPVAPALAAAIRDEDEYVRETVAMALQHVAATTPEAVPPLAGALADGRPEVRRIAVRLLLTAGVLAAPVAPALTDALADPDAEVRAGAASALARLGRNHAQAAFPALEKAATDESPSVRAAAVAALIALDSPSAGAAAGRALDDGSDVVVEATLMALRDVPTAPLMDPRRIIALASEATPEVRRRACFLLARHAQEEEALRALVKSLGDGAGTVRIAAAVSLEHVATRDPDALAALAAALEDEGMYVVRYAARALGHAGPAAGAYAPDLLRALGRQQDGPTRAVISLALGEVLAPFLDESRAALTREMQGDAGLPGVAAAVTLRRLGSDDPAVRDRILSALADPALGPSTRTLVRSLPEALRISDPPDAPLPSPGEGAQQPAK